MANKNKKYKRSIEDAGRISDEEYYNIMERVAERNYRDWGLPNPDAALLQALNDNSYNYRGYYNKYPNGDGNAKDHWTDEFKTVYHPTFSDESIYNGKKSQYNPNGLKGGTWIGETFMPRNWQRNKKENGGKSTSYITTSGGGYTQPINIERFKDYVKNKIYNYITGGLPIDTVRRRLYNNLFQGYDPGISNLYDNIKRVRNAIVNNEEEYKGSNKLYRQIYMDDLFAEYLQIPKSERRNIIKNYLTDSPYKPSINKNNVNYKRINHRYISGHSGLLPDDEERLVNAVMKGEYESSLDKYDINTGMPSSSISHGPVPLNKTAISKVLIDYGLGVHTISRGKDDKGEYVSYYDLWDMAPTKNSGGNNDESMGIGKPINIYDRVYLDDFYGVPNEYRGGYYIPEIIVKGNRKKHKDGGSIHIASSKRGTFTAAATKHKMGVQEFASRVLRNKDSYSPAMVEKANFARNASKWNK